jgi:predicted P-loop ATPase
VEHIRQALEAIAQQAPRDEMTDWLDSLHWDQTARLDHLAADAFGTDDELARSALKNHLVACVARQYKPGTKYDHMVILEGEQGTKKSTAITALFGPEYVSEIHGEPASRDALLLLRGKLVADLTELSAMRRADLERFKAWITLTVDEYRAPYARLPVLSPRRFVLMGTTNQHEYLSDSTGNRRFVPVRCGEINLDYLRECRAQLFAEAVVAYRDGYAFHALPLDMAKEAQAARVLSDPWTPLLAEKLIGKTETSVGQCLDIIDILNKDRSAAIDQRVCGCLRTLDEIAAWSVLDGDAKRAVLAMLPSRRVEPPDSSR